MLIIVLPTQRESSNEVTSATHSLVGRGIYAQHILVFPAGEIQETLSLRDEVLTYHSNLF